MLNIVHPDSGEACYFEQPLLKNEAEIKRKIGYSTGTISWYPRKKIRDIVSVTREFYESWDEGANQKYLKSFDWTKIKLHWNCQKE